MGLFPCSVHGAFFKGAAEAAYPALVIGAESEREHLRMCHDCFTQYEANCEERLAEAVVGQKPPANDQRLCLMCGGKAGRANLFVTLYPKGEEFRNFYGALCDADVVPARVAWLQLESLKIAV